MTLLEALYALCLMGLMIGLLAFASLIAVLAAVMKFTLDWLRR